MRVLFLLALVSAPAVCQPHPAFEIADVHASPRSAWVKSPQYSLQGGYLAGGRYALHNATMLDLIRTAYNVDAEKVYGGPAWLDYDRFEIVAKTKPGTGPETLRLMLQDLLAERFHLVAKQETRDVPGNILTRNKHELKMRPAAGSADGRCQSLRPTFDNGRATGSLQCRNVTVADLAAAIRGPLGNLPILDTTGLEGGWDVDFQFLMPTNRVPDNDSNIREVLDGLGLKVEAGKVPQPVMVVESVDQQPTPNPPGIAEKLPPLPEPAFEVAAIKWPCKDNLTSSLRFETGGRVTAICMPLMSLIKNAWNVPLFETPLGAPKWLADGTSTAHNISIEAKAPAGIAPDPQHNRQAGDVLDAMLRRLLMERYKMVVHYEDHPADAYTLVASKPKLSRADPAGRTGCTRQSEGGQQMVKLTCRNMTMAQFAEQTQAYDTEIAYPVLDGTNLQGAWDFTLTYDPMAGLNARYGLGPRPAGGEASDPVVSLTFRVAVEKELGLKFETHKRPVPTLVIDHIEEIPTEN